MKKIITLLLVTGLVLITLSGCGGSSPKKKSANTIETIKEYAESNGTSSAPNVQDYKDAGIEGVTGDNIERINAAIAKKDPKDVDTIPEIQTIVNNINPDTNNEEGSSGENTESNHAPTANAGADKTITAGETATLTCQGSDTDDDTLTYKWFKGNTKVSDNSRYTTLANLATGDHNYKCVVSDGKAEDSDIVTVTVTNTPDSTLILKASDVGADSEFDVEIYIDTKGKNVGAFNMFFNFDPKYVSVDLSKGDVETDEKKGMSKGEDTQGYLTMLNANDVANGHFRFAGITATDHANGNNVHIATIHLKTTDKFNSGTTELSVEIKEFADELGKNINVNECTLIKE